MFFQSFLQDVRIGLRVLFKEKTFCFLAVAVLALGICGATTQFAIVNGAALRGFSFPNPEQLVSIGFVDPQTDPTITGRVLRRWRCSATKSGSAISVAIPVWWGRPSASMASRRRSSA
jgi:hypothetical protein